jgi:small-conductance mechanosensitive channel
MLPLLLFSLYAADINATLVNGDIRTYESLLARVGKAPIEGDVKALQKALLYKLINLSKTAKFPPVEVPEPTDEKSYRDLVVRFGNWCLQLADIEKNIEQIGEKRRFVRMQIDDFDDNDSDLLTLQLQYAFYTKGKNLYEKKEQIYRDAVTKGTQALIDGVKRISFDTEKARTRLKKIDEEIDSLEKKIQELDVEKERFNLLGRTDRVKRINDRLSYLQAKKRNLMNDKMAELFILFSQALHEKKVKETFRLQNEMMRIVDDFYPPEVGRLIKDLFKNMETAVLGRAETFKGATLEEIESALSLFWEKANEPLFTLNKTPISAFKLSLALLIFILGIFIGGFYKSSIKRMAFRSGTFTASTRTLVANLGYYTIVIVAFFIALNVVGIDLSSIALVAGALSVGIGFGLQNIVSNFVSGIILMFERSIKIGDYIEFDENLRGHVSDIRMRSTTITTNDNIDVIVPNQDLIQNRVVNWTMNDQIRRFRIPFGVAYGSDVHKVVSVVKDAVRNSGFGDLYTDGERHTRVIMTGMGDSSVDFELFVWIRGKEILYPRRTTSRFLMLIYDALYEAGIEIPFPQRDIHIRSVDGDI